MMSERLKGNVSIVYTSNLGNYQSIKVEGGVSFWLDESSVERELPKLDQTIKEWMDARGVSPSVSVRTK